MPHEPHAIDRVFDCLSAGDIAGAARYLTPDARIWHCFDRVAHDRAGVDREWAAFVENFPERSFVDARTQPTPDGAVRQHMMIVTTADGNRLAWEVCVVVKTENGLIRRLDEYIDRAGSFAPPA